MAGVGASGRGAVAAYAARRLSCPFSMGLRPRLSAAAASRLYSNPPGWRFGDGCCRRLRGSTLTLSFSMGLRPRLSAAAASAAYWNPRGWRPGMIYQKIVVPMAGGGFGEAVGAERGNSFPATRLRLVGLG